MNQSITRQLAIGAVALIIALALVASFAPTVVNAQSATTTHGTTTKTYIFDAHLSGANEVPPIVATSSTSTNGIGTTTATTTGHSRVWFNETTASSTGTTTTTMLWNVLHVWNGNDIFGAHLHCGLPGQNGPVVVSLFNTATTTAVDVNGVLVATSSIGNGNITATTTGCSMPIRNVSELAAALKAGIIYANVHSVQYPSGVARGQLALTSSSTSHTSTTTPPMGTTTPPTTPTTTPPVIPGFPNFPGFQNGGIGIGGSINTFLSHIFGQVQHILHSVLPIIEENNARATRAAR